MKHSGSFNTHSRLAPSASARWGTCTASVAFEEANKHRVPKDTGSVFAAEGTEAHEWATKVLEKEITIDQVPEEFRPYIESYVEFCLGLIPEGANYLVETQVELFFQKGQTGTLDFGYVDNDLVVISDLKYGAGVLVETEDNTQLVCYALSLVRMFEDIHEFHPDTKVVLAIHQPRHREAANHKPWVLTLSELEAIGKDLEYRAIQAGEGWRRVREKLPCGERDIDAAEVAEVAPAVKFIPSEKACRFCNCRGFCSARRDALIEGISPEGAEDMLSAMPDLSKEESKEPTHDRIELVGQRLGHGEPLTNDYLVRLYQRSKAIRSFLDDVEEYLETLALEGRPVPGTKLVYSRPGNRDWRNPQEADTFLTGQKISADDRYTKKLISPTQAEKLLKDRLKKTRTANRFEELVTRSEPKKVLASEDDKREAVQADVEVMPDMETEDFEV